MKDRNYFIKKFNEWKREIWDYKYLIIFSLITYVLATIIDYNSGIYVTFKAQVVNVPDLILKYFGPIDFSFLFVWGFILVLFLFFLYPLFFNVKKIHIAILQFSILTILRSIFIILTHLGTPNDAIPVVFPGIFNIVRFHNDQFFSGHVAIPFLGFLLFTESKIKWLFLTGSIFLGIIVLAMHQHYSIDVFAAFFITYGSFKIGEWMLKKLKIFKIE